MTVVPEVTDTSVKGMMAPAASVIVTMTVMTVKVAGLSCYVKLEHGNTL